MKRTGIKIAACALTGTIAITSFGFSLNAKNMMLSTKLPAAGIAVVLDEGTNIEALSNEVVQNIAYLESASGIGSNIVIASEKTALSDSTFASGLSILNHSYTHDSNKNRIPMFTSEGEVVVDSTSEEEDTEETTEFSTEESSESATEEETEPSTEEEEEIRLSAGFSAVDDYKDIETESTEETVEELLEEDQQDFSNLVIAQVNDYVNVREDASEDSEVVGKLYDKSVGEFISEKNGWYKIKSGNCTGYVKGEYCVTGEEAEELAKEVGTTYAVVTTTTLKVREEDSTDAAVLGLVPIEEELVVVEEKDDWVKVAIEEGDGYVSRDYVTLRTDFVSAESKEEEEARIAKEQEEAARAREAAAEATQERQRTDDTVARSEDASKAAATAIATASASSGSSSGKAVIDYACQFVGNPYVYGGTSLTNGADCSGFVMSVYQNFGVSLPHSSSALRNRGYDVGGLQNAQPGDIVCYSGHVALYVGNGKIVHASTSRTGIIVSDNANYRNVLTVRRIF